MPTTYSLYTGVYCTKKDDVMQSGICIIDDVIPEQPSVYNTTHLALSNNALELHSILHSILHCINKDVIPSRSIINIYSTSLYAVNCINVWSDKWVLEGWNTKRKGKKIIKNESIIKEILEKITEFKYCDQPVHIHYISKSANNIYSKSAYIHARNVIVT